MSPLCFLLIATQLFVECTARGLNVVHIVSDDLRPEITAYGVPGRYTPNIDALGERGIVFDRAYAQQAVCGPSRNSFLSGRRPDASQTWNFINHFREDHPDWTSLPGMFKKAGMNSFGSGKLYHPFMPPNWDGRKSWSDLALPFFNPCWLFGISCLPCVALNGTKVEPQCSDFGFGPGQLRTCWCEVEATEDRLSVDRAISLMDLAKDDFENNGKQFYLAVGLHKPHLPWQAEKKYFDMYRGNVSLAKHLTAPVGMPGVAFSGCDTCGPWSVTIDEADALNARVAYYASTSGMDEQVGRVVRALEEKGLLNTTAIIFHGDHGWQLGEHGEWRKNTNFELGTRVPLIISTPDWYLPAGRSGGRSEAFAELVDMMPTMAELAGIELSDVMAANETPLGGVSLVPVLKGNKKEVKQMAFSQYPRRVRSKEEPWKGNGIDHVPRNEFTCMGYSVRTDAWRYTEWRTWDQKKLVADWTHQGLQGVELYDHRDLPSYPTDFDAGENLNLMGNGTVSAVEGDFPTTELSAMLRAQFRGDFPGLTANA